MQLIPEGGKGFGQAVQESYPLLLAMSQGLMSGQGAHANLGQGLAGMMALQDHKRELKEKADAKAASDRAAAADRSAVTGFFETMAGGMTPFSPARRTPTRNEAMMGYGGPTKSAAAAMTPSREQFLATLGPAALEVSQRTGVDPRIILAQAALETGWGKSAPGNNYFGIKSHGKPGGQTFTTHEVVDGQRVKMQDSFRQYGSPAESVHGYGQFLLDNPRYGEMLSAPDFESQIAALGRSGYATDPHYANKIGRIANSLDMASIPPVVSTQGGAQQIDPERLATIMLSPNIPAEVKNRAMQMAFPQAQPTNWQAIRGSDGGVYAFDPQTRQTVPILPGGEEPGFRRATPEEAAQYGATAGQFGPDNRFYPARPPSGMTFEQTPGGGFRLTQGAIGNAKPLTERQSTITLFGAMMDHVMPVINDLEARYDPSNERDRLADAIPLGNYLKTSEGKKYSAAAAAWAEAVLRLQTGAAATQPEIERVVSTYFAQAGDTSDEIAFKRGLRESFAQSLGLASGGLIEPGTGGPTVEAGDPGLQSEGQFQFENDGQRSLFEKYSTPE